MGSGPTPHLRPQQRLLLLFGLVIADLEDVMGFVVALSM